MKDKIELTFPKKASYLSVLRMTASVISSQLDYNIDEIEDIKVMVSEAGVLFINNVPHDEEPLRVCFELTDTGISISITDRNSGEMVVDEGDMGVMIIDSLSDTWQLNLSQKRIILTKKLEKQDNR